MKSGSKGAEVKPTNHKNLLYRLKYSALIGFSSLALGLGVSGLTSTYAQSHNTKSQIIHVESRITDYITGLHIGNDATNSTGDVLQYPPGSPPYAPKIISLYADSTGYVSDDTSLDVVVTGIRGTDNQDPVLKGYGISSATAFGSPLDEGFKFAVNEPGVAEVQVVDIPGRKIFDKKEHLNAGVYSVNLGSLGAPGVYPARVIVDGDNGSHVVMSTKIDQLYHGGFPGRMVISGADGSGLDLSGLHKLVGASITDVSKNNSSGQMGDVSVSDGNSSSYVIKRLNKPTERNDLVYPDSMFNYIGLVAFSNPNYFPSGIFHKIDMSAPVDTIKQNFRLLKLPYNNDNNIVEVDVYDSSTSMPIEGVRVVLEAGSVTNVFEDQYNWERAGLNKGNVIPLFYDYKQVIDSAFTDSDGYDEFRENNQLVFPYGTGLYGYASDVLDVSADGYYGKEVVSPRKNDVPPDQLQVNKIDVYLRPK